MSVRKSALIALRALRRNRLQTALTILGMMIGVGTVLAMIAVGSGAQRSITTQVRAAGMNIIVVSSGNYRMPQQWMNMGEAEAEPEPTAWTPRTSALPRLLRIAGQSGLNAIPSENSKPGDNPDQRLSRGPESLGGRGGATTLQLADADTIAHLNGVQAVSGGQHDNAALTAGSTTWYTQLRGEQATLPEIRRAWVLTHGRFFTPAEESRGESVAVLGSIVSEHLFGDRNPVGEHLTLRNQSFRVVGVLASGSWMVPAAAGDGQFDAVYIPVTTAQRLLHRDALDTVTLAAASTGEVTRLTKQITAELRQRHRLTDAMADDFTVATQARTAIARGGMRTDISRAIAGNTPNLDKLTLAQLGKTLEQASRTMAVLLASIAAVSLVVGGIGIMNIMLLSVTERTREIGIRRAVGAQSAEVMQQFLLEAVILSVGGGLFGIALGVAASLLVAHVVQWSTELSWLAIAISFTISAAVGIVFGYYPARQASRVTPMTSLRYE